MEPADSFGVFDNPKADVEGGGGGTGGWSDDNWPGSCGGAECDGG